MIPLLFPTVGALLVGGAAAVAHSRGNSVPRSIAAGVAAVPYLGYVGVTELMDEMKEDETEEEAK